MPLYAPLKAALRRDGFVFRVPAPGPLRERWADALLLNLGFWNAAVPSDVLQDESIDADVITHAAWHHLAGRALGGEGGLSAEGMLLGEAIASAFDVYMVGSLVGAAPRCGFLKTQLPAMADVCAEAGLEREGFEQRVQDWARDPSAAFESLRSLLFDLSLALLAAPDVDAGAAALEATRSHPLAALTHRYELALWVMSARHHGRPGRDAAARQLDQELRSAPSSLTLLQGRWLGQG